MPKLKAKPKTFHMGPEHRLKIANSNILNALIEHVEGEREMSSTQVTAGVALLKKVMPDMTENMVRGSGENGEIVHKIVTEIVSAKPKGS